MSQLESRVESRITELREELEDIEPNITEVMTNMEARRQGNTTKWSTQGTPNNLLGVLSDYEEWYNSALPLIADYLPDRESEFRERYNTVRHGLEMDINYIKNEEIGSAVILQNQVITAVVFQHSLLSSIPARVESESLKARKQISGDVTSSEVQKAKELFDEGDVRAAGVIAGVALERHLLTLCESSNQELEFEYMDGITSLATTLNTANEIDDDDKRLLEYLSGIRNKCSHATDEEPEKREVERMLYDTDEFLRSG